MFNNEERKTAEERLKRAANQYEKAGEDLNNAAGSLYQTRVQGGVKIIKLCEAYINALANSPKEFSTVVAELKFQLKKITGDSWEELYTKPDLNGVAGTAGVGVMAGAGVACFGPTAAMAIATTFGTASTGTAIASLSGAAATNAALAWLGGGAIAAGGGGMAGGSTLLALAGPVGWAIGGAALVGSGMMLNNKNQEIAKEANHRAWEIERDIAKVKSTKKEVNLIEKNTINLATHIQDELAFFQKTAPRDYLHFDQPFKLRLGTLINAINSLSESLKTTVDLKL